ncbi:MAG: imidazole glycerol phosphate synthase subunit HisH [Paludibacteraceae bacterium]
MKVSIIKYNAGNIQSVLFALQRIGVDAIVTDDKDEILTSDKIIFPGVGEASSAMNYLKEKKMDTLIRDLQQPVLGICLGMQLMCRYSEENNTECLGIFDLKVKHFLKIDLKIPQIGWNSISKLKSSIFKDVAENEYMYFVHSYYVEKCAETVAQTSYGIEYSSAIQKNNFIAVQFHPEKSGKLGQRILENFLKL